MLSGDGLLGLNPGSRAYHRATEEKRLSFFICKMGGVAAEPPTWRDLGSIMNESQYRA